YGPSYALSEADRERLAEILQQRRGGGSLPVMGFFRSFTSRDPLVEAADEEFVRKQFPQGDFVLLMLQPLSPRRCVASFRFSRDGAMLAAEEDRTPFAFDPPAMDSTEPQETRAQPAPTPRPATADTSDGPAAGTDRVFLPPPHRSRMDPLQFGTVEIARP